MEAGGSAVAADPTALTEEEARRMATLMLYLGEVHMRTQTAASSGGDGGGAASSSAFAPPVASPMPSSELPSAANTSVATATAVPVSTSAGGDAAMAAALAASFSGAVHPAPSASSASDDAQVAAAVAASLGNDPPPLLNQANLGLSRDSALSAALAASLSSPSATTTTSNEPVAMQAAWLSAGLAAAHGNAEGLQRWLKRGGARTRKLVHSEALKLHDAFTSGRTEVPASAVFALGTNSANLRTITMGIEVSKFKAGDELTDIMIRHEQWLTVELWQNDGISAAGSRTGVKLHRTLSELQMPDATDGSSGGTDGSSGAGAGEAVQSEDAMLAAALAASQEDGLGATSETSGLGGSGGEAVAGSRSLSPVDLELAELR